MNNFPADYPIPDCLQPFFEHQDKYAYPHMRDVKFLDLEIPRGLGCEQAIKAFIYAPHREKPLAQVMRLALYCPCGGHYLTPLFVFLN